MDVGTTVKRNFAIMMEPNAESDPKIKKIGSGAKFEVTGKRALWQDIVFSIKNKMGDSYHITEDDLNEYFYDAGSDTAPKCDPVYKKCVCCSIILREFGCKCGAIENKQDERYAGILEHIFAPERE